MLHPPKFFVYRRSLIGRLVVVDVPRPADGARRHLDQRDVGERLRRLWVRGLAEPFDRQGVRIDLLQDRVELSIALSSRDGPAECSAEIDADAVVADGEAGVGARRGRGPQNQRPWNWR